MLLRIILLLLMFSPFYGVDPTITVTLNPATIGTNEVAELRVNVIDQKPQGVPTLSTNTGNFDITYLGSSTQRQMNFINGAVDVKMIHSYIYRISPKKVGTITIPAFIVTTDTGKKIYTEASKLKIEPTAAMQAPSQRSSGFNPFNFFPTEAGESFLQWHVTRDVLAQNTSLIASLYVFVENPSFLENNPEFYQEYGPRFDGGTIHLMGPPDDNDIVSEQFGYQTFYGKILQRYLLFPLETGELFLYPPGFVHGAGGVQTGSAEGDPILIKSRAITDSLTYIGNEVTILIDFPKTEVLVSEEVPFTLTIEGDGNVDFFVNPFQNVSLSNLFIATPTNSLNLGFEDTVGSNTIFMRKTFYYTLIPRSEGDFEIPPIKLGFATPNGDATNSSSLPVTFRVMNADNIDVEDSTYSPLTVIEKNYSYNSGLIYILSSLLLGILMMIVTRVKSHQNNRLSTDINYARSTGAKKRLVKIMSESEEAIKKNQYKDASRLIRQSILYFCADKFSLSNSSSPQEIVSYLESKNLDFVEKLGFLSLMSDLDFYAFASTPSGAQIKDYLAQAYNILDDLDKIKIPK